MPPRRRRQPAPTRRAHWARAWSASTSQSNGTLKPVDFFAPSNATQLSTIDADFGSGGAVELPPSTFSTSKYPELIAAIGKEGYLYLLNAASLGGFGQGANGGNADVARIGPIGGVWGKTAVWPGDGGYAYVVSASQGGGPGALQALAWGTDASGNPDHEPGRPPRRTPSATGRVRRR